MASDDQELLAKISQLAGEFATRAPLAFPRLTNSPSGQINRHKNAKSAQNTSQELQSNSYKQDYEGIERFTQSNISHTDLQGYQQPSTAWRPSRGGYPSRGYARGARPAQVHRNRTLVLKGNSSTPGAGEAGANENERPSASKSNAAPGWVTKQDRHLQLINTTIFEKDSQNRAKAMEQTRQQKLKQRDDHEKARFIKHLQRATGNNYNSSTMRATGMTGNHEVEVNGIRFRVAQNGSKLVKVPGEDCLSKVDRYIGLDGPVMSLQRPGDLNAAKSTPKSALIGGVRFHRSKSGNMYRAGIIKAHRYGQSHLNMIRFSRPYNSANLIHARRTGVVKRINEPCKTFTTTGIPFLLE
jgi:hypothetical protein